MQYIHCVLRSSLDNIIMIIIIIGFPSGYYVNYYRLPQFTEPAVFTLTL